MSRTSKPTMESDYLERLNREISAPCSRKWIRELKLWKYSDLMEEISLGRDCLLELDDLFESNSDDYCFVSGELLYLAYLANYYKLIARIISRGNVMAFCNYAVWKYSDRHPDVEDLDSLSESGRGAYDLEWSNFFNLRLVMALIPAARLELFVEQFVDYTRINVCAPMNDLQLAIFTRNLPKLTEAMESHKLVALQEKAGGRNKPKIMIEIFHTMTLAIETGSRKILKLVKNYFHLDIKDFLAAIDQSLLVLLKSRQVNLFILRSLPIPLVCGRSLRLLKKLLNQNCLSAFQRLINDAVLPEKYYLKLLGKALELLHLFPSGKFIYSIAAALKSRYPDSNHTLRTALIERISRKVANRQAAEVAVRLRALKPAIQLVTKLHDYVKVKINPRTRGIVVRHQEVENLLTRVEEIAVLSLAE